MAMPSVRNVFSLLHRWAGLTIAAFLFIAGITGALISWDHELDDWLNPHLSKVQSRGPLLPPLSFIERVEQADPRVRVTYVPLHAEAGKSVSLFVQPRIDPTTGRPFKVDYNQVYFDPVTARELGRRERGKASLDRKHLLPFLYRLHYSLHVPEMWGSARGEHGSWAA